MASSLGFVPWLLLRRLLLLLPPLPLLHDRDQTNCVQLPIRYFVERRPATVGYRRAIGERLAAASTAASSRLEQDRVLRWPRVLWEANSTCKSYSSPRRRAAPGEQTDAKGRARLPGLLPTHFRCAAGHVVRQKLDLGTWVETISILRLDSTRLDSIEPVNLVLSTL